MHIPAVGLPGGNNANIVNTNGAGDSMVGAMAATIANGGNMNDIVTITRGEWNCFKKDLITRFITP